MVVKSKAHIRSTIASTHRIRSRRYYTSYSSLFETFVSDGLLLTLVKWLFPVAVAQPVTEGTDLAPEVSSI